MLQNSKQGKTNVLRGKIERIYVWLMSLEIKKRNPKND